MNSVRQSLYQRLRQWEENTHDHRDRFPYLALLAELCFHADLRFIDYLQYQQQDGSFLTRLDKWLKNVDKQTHQQSLFQLLEHLIFIDKTQFVAMYRDAYRRIIEPWLFGDRHTIDDLLSTTHDDQRRELHNYRIASVTESFNLPLLLHANDLDGIPRPTVLGEQAQHVTTKVKDWPISLKGCIVAEDIVGSGKQAGKILKAIEDNTPDHWRILFVPLICFEDGLTNIKHAVTGKTTVVPVVSLPQRYCLRKQPHDQEPAVFKTIRAIIKNNSTKLLEASDELDDPPKDPFGYRGAGGLIVTCHNTPNNTLPLIHHRAPSWSPLFRRVHHKEQ